MCGEANTDPIYVSVAQTAETYASPMRGYWLYPLEPFVFLECKLGGDTIKNREPWFIYKILTGNGLIGYLHLHDDDLCGLELGFALAVDEEIIL